MKARMVKSRLAKRITDRIFRAVAKDDRMTYNVPGDGTYSVQGKRTTAYFGGNVVERGVRILGIWFVTHTGF